MLAYGPAPMSMKKAIKTVGLIGKYKDEKVDEHIERLSAYLLGRKLGVRIDEHTAARLSGATAPSRPIEQMGKEIDLAIVVGGDGTMLNVARVLADDGIPLIGVNQGRLGFLTDIATEGMTEALDRILDGDYQEEQRLLLTAEVMRRGKIVHAAKALNDVIVTKGEVARLIEFETYVDGEFVYSARADGVIVATPTGSTAYAMSAGGPILHPTLPAVVIAPICPHSLTTRPIVVSSDSVIQIVTTSLAGQRAHLTFDGQVHFSLEEMDEIFVRRAEQPVRLIHPAGRNHYDVMREKLHWGRKV